jgi:NAD+ diphosphatase
MAATPALSRATHDRSAHRREDETWLADRWADASSRVLVVEAGRALVGEDAAGPSLVFLAPDEAPDGERFFLGVDGDTAYFAVVGALGRRIDARAMDLREVGALLGDRDAGLLCHAVGLANWHVAHPRCARCGEPTIVGAGGHVRRCPADGSEHFPRTDPAVIMLVHDGAGRCVLGRQPVWPPRFFSTLAGFVEPGEAAETAVVREVAEEVGLDVTDVEFRASQPWPFPSSLMLGFRARARSGDLSIDGAELAEARWFSRDELRSAIAREEVQLPPPVSIAWLLITEWLEARDSVG